MKVRQNIIKQLLNNVSDKGFFNLLSANILIHIVAFASQLLVAGILSPEDVGRIKIIQTWLSIFSILGSLGFNSATLKLCSENRSEKEVQAIFRSGVIFTFISTLLAYALVLVINSFGIISGEALVRSTVPLALLPLVANGLFAVHVSYFQAKKEIKFISNITSANKVVAVILIVTFTYFFGLKGYYWGYNIAAFSLLFIIFLLSRKQFKSSKESFNIRELFSTHWHYARPAFFSVLLADLVSYADILIINFLIFSQIESIGFYSFALTLTVALRVIPATVQQITIPYFSGMSSDMQAFKDTYRKYSKILILIIVGTLVVVLLLFPPFIKIVFTGKFNASIPYFIPLAIGWSIRQYNQIQAAALFGKGAIAEIAKSQVWSLFINIIIILLMLHFYGLIGVAFASIFCAIMEVLIFRIYFKRTLR